MSRVLRGLRPVAPGFLLRLGGVTVGTSVGEGGGLAGDGRGDNDGVVFALPVMVLLPMAVVGSTNEGERGMVGGFISRRGGGTGGSQLRRS